MTNSLKILLLAIIPLMLTLPVLAHAQDAPNDGDQVNSSKIDDTRSNEDWQEYFVPYRIYYFRFTNLKTNN